MIPNSPSGRAAPDWDAIARDYAGSVLSVSEICAFHSVPCRSLYDRAALEGWTLRRSGGLSRRRSQPDLTRRLLLALDLKMTQFENRMIDAASPVSAADSERDARTLGTLVRLFEKLKGFGEKAAASARAAPQAAIAASPGKDAHDADRLRQELAQRLEKLRAGLGG